MVFSSVTFLFFFPRRFPNAVLVAASLVFYTWGAGLSFTRIDELLRPLVRAAR